ncbi:DTW domain-containing protein 2 [Dorcoceras hygrometricum]|uniref:tRNA-uridine aminocarboxypropyltransferase n=1 Tax=Dorcoceras hygrometricum TaxID=472368 RepID=A0A2Z7DDG5_9LAMI|nr:DTW domain-containing protein 2 [Dorcoceras hygrometricum]
MASERKQSRRRICATGCGRPVNVCLCHNLPRSLIESSTQIVILHHPHEQRHKLATVPLLSKCLANCHIIVGRKLRYGDSTLLDSLHDQTQPNRRALFLFPGSDALALADVSEGRSSVDYADESRHVLIAFDGTWKHAKEMLLASLPFLSKFAIQVCLGFDDKVDGDSIFNSDLILRKEPFSGCMSTMEAVARSLRILEPNGIEIESSIIAVLKAMVGFQASFLKSRHK